MSENQVFSKTQALKMIEDLLGFPKPSSWYLDWYFVKYGERLFIPRVNFVTLALEIKETKMVERLGQVVQLNSTDPRRQAVITAIYGIVEKHKIAA